MARFNKLAYIAETAGINICLYGLYETGVITCAANQVGSTISHLDDDKQYMNHFLSWDIIKSPNLTLLDEKLSVLKDPGLRIEIDLSVVKEGARFYQRQDNI
jgi:L-alanine-DL-glutamate epimerase-like enolase superfamily enzyme